MSASRTISVLRCSAAGVALGFAADEVSGFSPEDDRAPRLAELLGIEDPALWPERTLRLDCSEGQALLRVEVPVHIRTVTGAEILAVPRVLGRSPTGPVIGFLEEAGQVVVLLDVRAVVKLARQSAAAGETRWPC